MKLKLNNITAYTIIGAWEYEKQYKQPLVVNVELEYDASAAIKSDDIKDAINYAALAEMVTQAIEEQQFELVETAVDKLLNLIIAIDKISWVKISASKTKVSLPSCIDGVVVEGERHK